MSDVQLLQGDCLEKMKEIPDGSINTCITSPPYFGLRDYDHDMQIGLEQTPAEFVESLVKVFREIRRVLKDDGTVWLNLGDSYARQGGRKGNRPRHWDGRSLSADSMSHTRQAADIGFKPKDLIGVPWRVAFALQDDGWYLRQDIIWNKTNPIPESVKDRCVKSHEYIFLLSKNSRYYFDADSIREPSESSRSINEKYNFDRSTTTRKKRSVWTVSTKPYKGAHLATFPPTLIEPCVLAGCPVGGTVLDPFVGSGTTGMVSVKHDRNFIGIDINQEYLKIAEERIKGVESDSTLNNFIDWE